MSSAFYHGERTADWTITEVVLSRMALSLCSCRHRTHALALSRAETFLRGLGGPRFTDEETEAEAQHVAQALQAGGSRPGAGTWATGLSASITPPNGSQQ